MQIGRHGLRPRFDADAKYRGAFSGFNLHPLAVAAVESQDAGTRVERNTWASNALAAGQADERPPLRAARSRTAGLAKS